MKNYFKKAIFISIPYLVFILITESALYLLDDKKTCKDPMTNYGYCPNFSEIRDLGKEEQNYQMVNIFVDEFGGRQPGSEPLYNPAHSSVFIIGDSFIQADEIPYEQTLYGVLNSAATPTYALGYSSWNPIQYKGAIRKLKTPDGEYHVFLMTNDFTPSYDRSAPYEIRAQETRVNNSALQKVWGTLVQSSRLVKLIDHKTRAIFSQSSAQQTNGEFSSQYQALLSGHQEVSFARDAYRDCGNIDQIWDGSAMSDYLMFAKHHSCWPAEFKKGVDLAVTETQKIQAMFGAEVSGNLTLYLIPPGWALPFQNTQGRLHSLYGIPVDKTVSQIGLSDYLLNQGVDIIDLESFLYKHLQNNIDSCGQCENLLYLRFDGHWTNTTHKLIAAEILH